MLHFFEFVNYTVFLCNAISGRDKILIKKKSFHIERTFLFLHLSRPEIALHKKTV